MACSHIGQVQPCRVWGKVQWWKNFKRWMVFRQRNDSLSSRQASGLSVGDWCCWSASTVTCCSLHWPYHLCSAPQVQSSSNSNISTGCLRSRRCSRGGWGRKCRSTQLQILSAAMPDYVRTCWLAKANKQFPKLAFAANKLLSAHTTWAAAECNWSAWGCTYTSLCSTLCLDSYEAGVC